MLCQCLLASQWASLKGIYIRLSSLEYCIIHQHPYFGRILLVTIVFSFVVYPGLLLCCPLYLRRTRGVCLRRPAGTLLAHVAHTRPRVKAGRHAHHTGLCMQRTVTRPLFIPPIVYTLTSSKWQTSSSQHHQLSSVCQFELLIHETEPLG